MTVASAKRTLPLLPHPEHLRKQAKARLAELRAAAPATRLAEAQLLLAHEYGFASWNALQAEVAHRTGAPRTVQASLRRPPEPDGESDHPARFLRSGMIVQVGFIVAALVGVAMVLVPNGQGGLTASLARLLHAVL